MNKCILAILLAGALQLSSISSMAQQAPSKILRMGTLGGAPITIRELPEEAVNNLFLVQHRRSPSLPGDAGALQQIRKDLTCGRLRTAIQAAGFDIVKTQFAISASESELAKAREKRLHGVDIDQEAARVRARAIAFSSALAEVFDKGAKPDDVFQKTLAGLGVTRQEWDIYVLQGRSAAFRAQVAKGASLSPAGYVKALENVTAEVQNAKLKAAVDSEIAAHDSTFKEYRDEVEQSVAEKRPVLASHVRYVETKREEWWREFYSRAGLVLNEPALKDKCGLTGFSAPALSN